MPIDFEKKYVVADSQDALRDQAVKAKDLSITPGSQHDHDLIQRTAPVAKPLRRSSRVRTGPAPKLDPSHNTNDPQRPSAFTVNTKSPSNQWENPILKIDD